MSTAAVFMTARVRFPAPKRADGGMSNGDEYLWRSAPRKAMLLIVESRGSVGWKITVLTLAPRRVRTGWGWGGNRPGPNPRLAAGRALCSALDTRTM